jgi:flavin-dependent dehydrogenase
LARIIVLGGGVCGLAAALLLRRDGHQVTVLERDQAPVPPTLEAAWEHWERAGVSQFRQAHYLVSRGRAVLAQILPDVLAELERAGAARFDPLCLMPPSITDRAPREGDERFVTVTARRTTLEYVFARAAEAEPGLDVRRGVSVRELVLRQYNGVPHVRGVRTDSGEQLIADLVVDAMGRRSHLPRWLREAGAGKLYEEAEDSGFIYYTRYFRSRDGGLPVFRAPLGTPVGTFSVVTLPADNGTWSVTLFVSAGDKPLKQLRHPELWNAVLRACPLHSHLLDGEPITDVMAIGGVIDRYRRLSVGGEPVATGIALVGDAWACTNPSLGRGITFGLLHAQHLRDVVRAHFDDARELAEAWDAVTETELTPWYRETVEEDRVRFHEIEALRNGTEPQHQEGSPAGLYSALLAAVPRDADAFRAFLAARCCLTPLQQTLSDQSFVERMLQLVRDGERPALPGPDRDRLLRLLDGAHAPVNRRPAAAP